MLTVAGLVIGTGLALGAAQAAKSLLYGLKPRDPLTLVTAIVTLSAVAALASFLPAIALRNSILSKLALRIGSCAAGYSNSFNLRAIWLMRSP